jgi:hypothetical protein
MLDRLVLLLLFELRIPSPSGRGVCQRSPFYLAAEKSVEIHTPVDPPDLPPHDLGDLHDPQRLDGPTNGPTDQPGNSGTIIRGRIDALVFVPEFWVLAIEAKRSQYSLEVGIPQLLAYMLDAPQRPTGQPVWGLVTNGREFQFMKVQAACAGEGWDPNPDGPNPDGARGGADPTGRSPVPPSDSPDPGTIYALSDLFSIYRGRDLDWVLQILRRIAAVYQSESASITPTP